MKRKFSLFKSLSFMSLLILGSAAGSLAEGTGETTASSTDRTHLLTNYGEYNDFGRYNGSIDQRLFIHIENPESEVVYFGFSQFYDEPHWPNTGSSRTGYFRIKDPSGNVVWPTPGSNAGQLNGAVISNRSQAVNGPNQIVGSGGYNAYTFNPDGLPAGDYYIEFSNSQSAYSSADLVIPWYDITVATEGGSPAAIDGRVFSYNWAFMCPSIDFPNDYFDRDFTGTMFIYSDDGFVSSIDFSDAEFQGAAFNIAFNSFGVSNTGDFETDRASVEGVNSTSVQYKVFLNNPDETAFPNGTFGEFVVDADFPRLYGCPDDGEWFFRFAATEAGRVEVLIDSNGNNEYDPGTADVLLDLEVIPYPGETAPYERDIPWNGLDGLGVPIPTGTDITVEYSYSQGFYHLPVYDVEHLRTGMQVNSVRPTTPQPYNPTFFYDDENIGETLPGGQPALELNGCTPPCHYWNDYEYGNVNTINTFWYAYRSETIFTIPFETPPPTCAGCPFTPLEILGTVFHDVDENGTQNSEDGLAGVGVSIYGDVNGNNTYEPGIDTLIDSGTTDGNGDYSLIGSFATTHLIVIDQLDLPDNSVMTTPSLFTAVFFSLFDASCDNNFGFVAYPVAVIDYDTIQDTSIPLIVDVQDNDTIPFPPVTTSIVTPPVNGGTATPNPDGTITYTSIPDYIGVDSLEYSICDADGLCDTAWVVIQIGDICGDGIDNDGDGFIDNYSPEIVLNAHGENPTCIGFSDGTLSVTATGGRAPYYYSWSDAGGEIATTADVSGVGAGFYTITVTDENGCDESFGVLLQEFNCPPVANNDFNNTLIDLPVSGNMLTNDWDPQGDALTVSSTLLDQPDNGSVTFSGNGDYTYTPNSGFTGEDSFIYIVCDGGVPNGCDTATVFIEVIPITAGNEPPIANTDVAQTLQGIPVSSNVLTNDDDPDGDNIILNVTPLTGPNNGSVTMQPNGSFTYTPNPSFIGVDTYTYNICDDGVPSLCDTTVVTINVLEDPTSNNQPPFAGDDGAVTNINTPVTGNLLDNDSDPDGDNIVINQTPLDGPGNGSVTIDPDGSYEYQPDPGFSGTDIFTYSICDDGIPSLCDTATVTILVVPDNGGNEPPIAQDDEAQTNQDVSVSGNVQGNDGDPDGDPITSAGPIDGPSNGSVTVDQNGDFTYTPDPGFTGVDTFTYQTCDNGGLCDTATVTITVIPPLGPGNDPPFAGDDAALTPQEIPVSGNLLLNDNDPNGDNIILQTTPISGPNNGGVTILPDGTYTYNPGPGFTGTDQFVYEICDDGVPSLCAQATCYITVYPDNNPPIAEDDFNNTLVNTPINGNVITNDSDPDGDNIAVSPTLLDTPDNGSVVINPDGTYTYTPNLDFEGEDSFTYILCDDGVPVLCDTAEVAIEVVPITLGNEPPIANDDVAQTLQGVPVTSNILVNDDDPDGDPITLTTTPLTGPSNGTVSIQPDGTFTYTPAPAFTGIDTYTYRICDDGVPSLCDTATVTIDVLPDFNGPDNDPPFAGDDGALTPQDVPVSGQLLTNDTDPNGDNIIIQLPQISGPSNGSVVVNIDGTYTYTPNPGYTGPDQFVYEICDDGVPSLCAQATCYITVYPDNTPPVAINDFNNTLVDIPVTGDVITNDFDLDGDNISVNSSPLVDPVNGSVTLASTGVYTYTPNAGFEGEDSFVYILCDDGTPSLCDTALVVIEVIPTTLDNDPPVANPDAYVTMENVPLTHNILINDVDPDGDNLILNTSPISGPNNGTVNILPDGTLTYTPNTGFVGQDTLTYFICDDGVPSLCDTTNVIITVLPDRNGPDNDPPFAGDDAALTPVNVPVLGEILSNDFDPNGDNIIVQLPQVTGPFNGTVNLNLDGTYTYTPNTDYIGPDQFVYQICDDGNPVLCATATVYITVYPGPYIEWDITSPLCNGDANGAIDITVFNATLPVTYSWSNGATTEDISGIPAATYVVTVTDALGSVVQESITVTEPDVLGVSTSVVDESTVNGCNGSATANPTGGTPPYSYLWDDPAAQTTQTASNLCAGIYQVFITDSNGCDVSTSIVINPPSCDLDVLVTGTNVDCNGGSDGSAAATPITAQNNTPFTYVWNNGATTQSLSGITAGPYSVEITDAIGCQASGSITITEPAALSISTVVVDEQNFEACDGSATATVSGGTPPYIYQWDDPAAQTTAAATDLCPGTYTVVVTDANGCTSQVTITVNELSCTGFIVSINPYDLSCFGEDDGSAAAVVSGGTAPFEYNWNTAEVLDSIFGLSAGTYIVTVTDDVGCEQTVSAAVTQPALLEAATAVDDVTCYGFSNGTIELTVTGGTTPYSFNWSNGATSEDLAGLGPDTYDVTVTDANGCTVDASGVVTEPDSLDASSVDVNITCNGGSDGAIDLTVEGGLGPYLVTWDSGQSTEDISGLTAGTYTATIVDQNGCILSYTTTLTEADEFVPTVTPDGPTTFCDGGQVGLTATAGASYAWSTGDTTQTIIVTTSGAYSVVVTTPEGCVGTAADVVVTVNPLPQPVISAVGPTEFCEGGSVTLTTGSYSSYAWSTGDTTQSIVVSVAGSYTVTVTNVNGCIGTSSATTVTVNPLPTPTITADGPTTFCDGDNVVLTSSAAVNYQWSTGETTQSIIVTTTGSYTVSVTDVNGCMGDSDPIDITVNDNPTPTITPDGPTEFCDGDSVILTSSAAAAYVWSTGDTTQSITVTTSGTYNVTVVDANGCVGTSAGITIDVNDLPTPTVTPSGPTTFCEGGSVTLTASGATAYLWSTGETTQAITVSTTGTYVVTVTDANGCSADSDGVDVTVNPLPTPTITASGPTQFCDGGSVDLTLTDGASWLWNTGATSQTITVSNTGSYWATVTDGNGCSANSDTVEVVVDDNPVPTITPDGPTEFCTLDTVTLTASTGVSYLWSTGDTTQSITVDTSGVFTVTVTDAQGCTGTSAPTQVVVNPLPDATVSWNSPLDFCPGDSVRLISRPAVSYLWSNGDTTIFTDVFTSGEYTVLVTDENGCQRLSDTITVTVYPQPMPWITADGPLEFCDEEDVVLTLNNNTLISASGPFLWNTSETTLSITVENSGSYWAELVDLNGCTGYSDTVDVTVWELPDPVISTDGPPSFCVGDTIFLTSTPAETYLWSTGDTTQVIMALVTGEYSVTVTDTNGCTATSPPTFVDIQANPNPTITPDGFVEICEGDSIVLTAAEASSYLWNTGDTTQTILVTAAGTYNVTATDSTGCSGSSSDVVVSENPNPEPTITLNGPNEFCEGGDVTLSTQTFVTYQWSTGASSQSITVSATGIYNVLVTDTNGCMGLSPDQDVEVNELPEVVVTPLGPTEFCEGGSVVLSATNEPGYTYLWSTGDTTQTITVTTSGAYNVVVTDEFDCVNESPFVNVTVYPLPNPVITPNGPTEFCDGDSVVLSTNAATSYLWSTGATTQSITVSTSGTFTVTHTSSFGCVATSDATTVTVNDNPTPTITANGPTEFCEGGSVELTAGGGSTYLWSTGQTTPVITVSESGNYSVLVTDSNGCSTQSGFLTITEWDNPVPTITADGPAQICEGDTVVLTSSAAAGYLWSTGETTQSILVTESGNYVVTVTDTNGCVGDSQPMVITVFDLPDPTITVSGPTEFCNGDSVTLSVSTGVNYLWSTGETTQSITVHSTGSYSVTVTDANGCEATSDPMDITVYDNPEPTITPDGPTTICDGQSVVLTSSTAVSYLWNTGASTQQVTVGLDTTYWVQVTDINGCIGRDSIDITVNPTPTPVPTITADGPTTFCEGDSVSLSTDPWDAYLWSNGDTTQTTVVDESGLYTVTVTNEFGCEADAAGIVVTVDPIPEPTILANTNGEICEGETVNLSTQIFNSYTWSTGDTAQLITVDSTGSYSVTVTNSFGCEGTSENFDVLVRPLPDVDVAIDGETLACNGDSILLSGISEWPLTWSTGQNDSIISVTTPGDYWVSALDTNGCVGYSDTLTLDFLPPFNPTIEADGPTAFCEGDDLTLTVLEGVSWLWSTGDTTQSIVVTTTDIYSVTVVDTNGCEGVANITVTVLPSPIALIIPDSQFPYCEGDTVVLTASFSLGGDYLWSPNGETTQSITVTENGIYSVTVTNLFGCSDDAVLPVLFTPVITPTISVGGDNILCVGEEVILTSSFSTGSYLWSPNGETTQSITVTAGGSYSVTTTNILGCEATSDAEVIEERPAPTVVASDDISICIGDTAMLTATGNGSFIWSTGESGIPIFVAPTETTTYSVVVSSPDCEITATDEVTVIVNDPPSAAFSFGDTYLGEPIFFSDSSEPGNIISWDWEFGNGETSTDQNASYTYTQAGDYTVLLTVTDENGCTDTASALLDVERFFIITNVLTPNGDGFNDWVWIRNSAAEMMESTIYDRWGHVVWQGFGKDQRWDGRTSAGVQVESGTFYYVIKMDEGEGPMEDLTGYITVIR